MANILFLSQRIPYPPDKGEKIRSYRMFSHLAKRHRVFLGCFIDDPFDLAHREKVEGMAEQSHIPRLHPGLARIKSGLALASGAPLSKRYFFDAGLKRWTNRVLAEVQPEAVFVFSSVMAQYVPATALKTFRYVVDYVDVDSEKFAQYAEGQKGPMRAVYSREAKSLLAFDERVATRADACLFVTAQEAELFKTKVPKAARKVHAVGNGIDTDYFSPEASFDPVEIEGNPLIVFTGRMDYWPNVDAVQWFAERVFPSVRNAMPGAHFAIVGAAPSPKVLALGEMAGITVTGKVPDIRPYLKAASLAVAPLKIARGLQNKVLEALAMGTPVVVTPQGLEGIAADPGTHLLTAETPDQFLEAIKAAALPDRAQGLASAGRALVDERYEWDAQLALLDRHLGF
ncbi:MAG: TIGR03087 family PEP-CTERM/XrtA system glycosyltransferase [Pseudomonadota bacterium]